MWTSVDNHSHKNLREDAMLQKHENCKMVETLNFRQLAKLHERIIDVVASEVLVLEVVLLVEDPEKGKVLSADESSRPKFGSKRRARRLDAHGW